MSTKTIKTVKNEKLYILLVGVNTFTDENLNNLQFCANGAENVAEALQFANQNAEIQRLIIHSDFTDNLPVLEQIRHSLNPECLTHLFQFLLNTAFYLFYSLKPNRIIIFFFRFF